MTTDELKAALSTVDEEHPLKAVSDDCGVYRLKKEVNNEKVILKVINNNDPSFPRRNAKDEAWATHNVEQLLGWAHTPNKALYYFFIKNMGVPYGEVPMLKKDPKLVLELREEATKLYESQYHLTHE